ncbi:MAG: PepSY domain-containing protein [Hydrogenobacter sp.]
MRKLLLAGATAVAVFSFALAEEGKIPNPADARISPQEAINIAKSSVQGNVLGYELEDEDGKLVYGVKIAKGSEIHDVKVDAQNGKVVKVEKDEEDAEED